MNRRYLLCFLVVFILLNNLDLLACQSVISRYRVDKIATRVFGDGTANGALYNPTSSFRSSDGSLYISEQTGIRKVSFNGTYSSVSKRSYTTSRIVTGSLISQTIFYSPGKMFISPLDGYLYIIDRYDNRLFRLDSNGKLDVVLGTISTTSCKDGVSPLNCAIVSLQDCKQDARNGDLYFIERNTSIKKVSANSVTALTIIPVSKYYSAISLYNDELYVVVDSKIYSFNLTSGVLSTILQTSNDLIIDIEYCGNGDYFYATYNKVIFYQAATNETRVVYSGSLISDISSPITGKSVCSEIYVTDSSASSVYKITNSSVVRVAGNQNSGIIQDNVPSMQGGVISPSSIVLDENGDLLISDTGAARIRKVSISTGLISTIAGNGNGTIVQSLTSSPLNFNIAPYQMAFSKDSKELFFADQGTIIRKINKETETIEAVAGYSNDNIALYATITYPTFAMQLDNGETIIIEEDRIGKILLDGSIEFIAGNRKQISYIDGPALATTINPYHTAVNQQTHDIYFVDSAVGSIRKYNNANKTIDTVLKGNYLFALSPDNADIIYFSKFQLVKYNLLYNYSTVIAGTGLQGVSVDNFNATGNKLSSIISISISNSGYIYFIENYSIRILFPSNNSITTIAGSNQCSNVLVPDGVLAKGSSICPTYIHYSEATSEIFYVEASTVIRKIGIDGRLYTVAGELYPSAPFLIEANPKYLSYVLSVSTNSNGDLFFTEYFRGRVSMVRRNESTIQTIINGNGDGEYPQYATFSGIRKLGFSKNNDLYILSDNIRKLSNTSVVSTVVSNVNYNYYRGLIVSDIDNSLIVCTSYQFYKITSNAITSIAGGSYGFSPDGTLASAASFLFFFGTSLVQLPNSEIIFQDGYKLRKIASDGRLYTIAGTTSSSFMEIDSYSDALTVAFDTIQDIIFESKTGKFYFITGASIPQIFSMTPYCPSGYVFEDVYQTKCMPVCFGISANQSNVCSGNGNCILPNTCQCNGLFVGANCSQTFCDTPSGKSNSLTCPTSNTNTTISSNVQTVSDLQTLNGKTVAFSNIDTIKIDLPSSMSSYLTTQVSEPIQVISLVSKPDPTPLVETTDNSTLTTTVLTSVVTLLFIKTSDGGKIKVQNLDKPISFSFTNITYSPAKNSSSNLLCSYFDEETNSWKFDGLSISITSISSKNSLTTFSATCKSSHLTSFVIIDQNLKKAFKEEPDTTLNFDNTNVIIAATVSVVGGLCVLGVVGAIVIVSIVILMKRRRKTEKQAL